MAEKLYLLNSAHKDDARDAASKCKQMQAKKTTKHVHAVCESKPIRRMSYLVVSIPLCWKLEEGSGQGFFKWKCAPQLSPTSSFKEASPHGLKLTEDDCSHLKKPLYHHHEDMQESHDVGTVDDHPMALDALVLKGGNLTIALRRARSVPNKSIRSLFH